MSSIRPLITITILAAAFVFLYIKINEGPPHPSATAERPPVGVPALDTTAGSASSLIPPLQTSAAPAAPAGGTAPAWNSNAAQATAPPAARAIDSGTSAATPPPTADNLPPVPSIPDLPPLAGGATTSAVSPPPAGGLPAGIPTATYPGMTPDEAPAAQARPGAVSGRVPSLGTSTPDVAASSAPPMSATPPAAPTPPSMPAGDQATSPYGASATVGAGPPPALPATLPPDDRYGATSSAPSDPYAAPTATPTAPPSQPTDQRYGTAPLAETSDSSFAAAWPVIQTALARQELARAHLLLSQWYGDESLTPTEAQKVESLLSQLAGTVVYSTEHRLEPPYTVRPGDRLDTIARQYGVPWQLLAKINGIRTVDGVQPGQQLKVVRGPFSAVVELRRGVLTLTLDGRYAGRFPVRVEPGATEGDWVVDEKLAVPAGVSRYAAAPTSGGRTLVLRSSEPASPGTTLVIAGDSGQPTAQPAGIHISPSDAEELSDILSIGSKVLVRR